MLTQLPACTELAEHCKKLSGLKLPQLFAEDPKRAERFTIEALGLYFDYSKHRIDGETVRLLLDLAEQSGLRQHIDAMFAGEKINFTEDCAVLHVDHKTPTAGQTSVEPNVHKRGHYDGNFWRTSDNSLRTNARWYKQGTVLSRGGST